MNGIKNNMNFITGILMLALTAFNIIFATLDLLYRPKSYELFGAGFFIVLAVITFVSVKYRKSAHMDSVKFASFMPLIALVYEITLFLAFDMSIDGIRYNLLYYEGMLVLLLVCSLINFFVYNKVIWLKIIVGILSAGFAVLLGFIILISFFFWDFGETKIIETLNSPDGTYIAKTISQDDGALGGDTYVRVYHKKPVVTLLFGSIIYEGQQLWLGDWSEKPTLKWEDNDTILINDVSYDVK